MTTTTGQFPPFPPFLLAVFQLLLPLLPRSLIKSSPAPSQVTHLVVDFADAVAEKTAFKISNCNSFVNRRTPTQPNASSAFFWPNTFRCSLVLARWKEKEDVGGDKLQNISTEPLQHRLPCILNVLRPLLPPRLVHNDPVQSHSAHPPIDYYMDLSSTRSCSYINSCHDG